jgi:hypothetical protein
VAGAVDASVEAPADGDAEVDADTDAGTEAGADAGADSGAEADGDADGDADVSLAATGGSARLPMSVSPTHPAKTDRWSSVTFVAWASPACHR